MISYRALLVSLLGFTSLIMGAQTKSIQWSPQQHSTGLRQFFGADQDKLYAHRQVFKYYLERFDSRTLELDYSIKFGQKIKGAKLSMEQSMLLNGKIVVFASGYSKRDNKNTLYYKVFATDGIVEKEWQVLTAVSALSRSQKGAFSVHCSEDSNHILIVAEQPWMGRKENNTELLLLNNRLEKVSSRLTGIHTSINQILVDKEGTIYNLAVGPSFDSSGERRFVWRMMLETLRKNEDSITVKEYYNEDREVVSCRLGIHKDGDIVISGYYLGNRSKPQTAGAFFMKVDKQTKEIRSRDETDFSTDVSDRLKSRYADPLSPFNTLGLQTSHLLPREGGGYFMIGEQLFYSYHTYSVGQSLGHEQHAHHNDILITAIDEDGKIEWIKNLPRQTEAHSVKLHSGYSMTFNGEDLTFIYLENQDNYDGLRRNALDYLLQDAENSATVIVTVDDEANVKVLSVVSNTQTGIKPHPKNWIRFGSSLFLFAKSGGAEQQYRVGRFDFSD